MSDVIDLTAADFDEDRYSRFKLIPWWNQDLLKNAKIMVVGAGALGNELIKNLALLGIGNIYVYDIDTIENTNLTRSVLFRRSDIGRYKAEVAAERAMEINPYVTVHPYVRNIIDDVGLGVFRRMDIVLGGLDNREARLAINQACYKVNKPWIDGAIEALNGFARVFVPGVGACYECTMTETDWKLINKRKSCSLLTNKQLNEGKIPTTPTSSSVIAGIQVQEMLKLLHKDRNLPTLAGKGYVFNGLTHDSYIVEYQRKEDCLSHCIYNDIHEMPWSVNNTRLETVLNYIKDDFDEHAIIDLECEVAVKKYCSCGEVSEMLCLVHKLEGDMLICPKCGGKMQFDTTHIVKDGDPLLKKTPGQLGIPPLHVLCGRIGRNTRYYEFSDDVCELE